MEITTENKAQLFEKFPHLALIEEENVQTKDLSTSLSMSIKGWNGNFKKLPDLTIQSKVDNLTRTSVAIAHQITDHLEHGLPDDPEEILNQKIEAMDEATKKKYEAAKAAGATAKEAKDYATAKKHYEEALSLLPEDAECKTAITELDGLIATAAAEADTAAAATAKANEEQANANFTTLVGNGDKAFTENRLTEAKGVYEEALKLKPEDAVVKEKITEVDKAIAALNASSGKGTPPVAKQESTGSALLDLMGGF